MEAEFCFIKRKNCVKKASSIKLLKHFRSINCYSEWVYLRRRHWMWLIVHKQFEQKILLWFDYCLTVHHQLGKVIQMNQLDATMIYWSIRSAQHVSDNHLPIIRSVRLRFLQHMVTCCGGQGDGERQRQSPCPPPQQVTICCKNLSLTPLMMGKWLSETCWADLIDQ